MLGRLVEWGSSIFSVKVAEAPVKTAEESTKNQGQREPTEKATVRAAPPQMSESTNPEPRLKPAETTEKSAGSSKAVEKRLSAEVKFFQPFDRGTKSGGFGFLLTEDGDLFLHHTGIKDGTVPEKGAVYEYDLGIDQKKGGPIATNATLVETAKTAAQAAVADPNTKDLFEWAFIPPYSSKSAGMVACA